MFEQMAALDRNPQMYAIALERANGLIGSDPRIQELAERGDVRFHALYKVDTIKNEGDERHYYTYPLTGDALVTIALRDEQRVWVLPILVELGLTEKEAYVDFFGDLTEKYFKPGQEVKSMYSHGQTALVVVITKKVQAGDKYGNCEIQEVEGRKDLAIVCSTKKGEQE